MSYVLATHETPGPVRQAAPQVPGPLQVVRFNTSSPIDRHDQSPYRTQRLRAQEYADPAYEPFMNCKQGDCAFGELRRLK